MFSFERFFNVINTNQSLIWAGIATTLLLSFIGTFVGLLLGIPLAYGKLLKTKTYDNKLVRFFKGLIKGFCNVYSTVLRGTPMMVQALIFKFGCVALGLNWGNILFPAQVRDVFNGWFFAGLIVITFNTAAYMGEVVISGLNGVDKGQYEGAKSLGLSDYKISFNIVLPQALKNSLPTIGNELIVNIKDSSVLNVIAVSELFYRLQDIAVGSYAVVETYVLLAIIYLIMTALVSVGLKLIERMLDGEKISLNPFGRIRRNFHA